MPLAIDELPLVALLGCFAEGETVVRGAAELRLKESDRIATVVDGLRGLGADIEATEDGFAVRGTGGLRGGTMEAHGDHRLAMLGAVAGLASREGVEVVGMEAAAVSYPGFTADLERLLSQRPEQLRRQRQRRGSFARGCSAETDADAAIARVTVGRDRLRTRRCAARPRRRAPPRPARGTRRRTTRATPARRAALPAVAAERGRRASCGRRRSRGGCCARRPARLDPALGVERAERVRHGREQAGDGLAPARVGVQHAPVEVEAELPGAAVGSTCGRRRTGARRTRTSSRRARASANASGAPGRSAAAAARCRRSGSAAPPGSGGRACATSAAGAAAQRSAARTTRAARCSSSPALPAGTRFGLPRG